MGRYLINRDAGNAAGVKPLQRGFPAVEHIWAEALQKYFYCENGWIEQSLRLCWLIPECDLIYLYQKKCPT